MCSLLGYNKKMLKFKFIHGTQFENLPFLLRDKVIHKSSDIKNMDHVVKDFGGLQYIYGNIIFEDIDVNISSFTQSYFVIIDDNIIKSQKIIFNSKWTGFPLETEIEST